MAGLGGSLRLGKVTGPIGGAESGPFADVKGLGGVRLAVAGLVILTLPVLVVLEVGDGRSALEASDCSLLAVLGMDSGVISPEAAAVAAAAAEGELTYMALVRKSV